MSANASLTIVGGPQRIEPGHETTLTAQIINLGTVPDDFRLSVREIDPGWVTFRPPTVFLQPGDQATAAIVIAPPYGIPAGSLRPIFRLLSRRAGNVAIVEIAMPIARAAAPPPYQPPTRAQTPPAATRQAPTPAVATPPTRPTPTSATREAPLSTAFEPERPDESPTSRGLRDDAPTVTQRRRAFSPRATGLGGGLLLLLLLGVVAAAFFTQRADTPATAEPTAVVASAATEAPPTSTATTVLALPAATPPTATAAFAAKTFIVANTGGEGVYLRRTTDLDDRDTPYADGTELTQLGPDLQASGNTWRHVRTLDGKVGYVPAQYTQPVP